MNMAETVHKYPIRTGIVIGLLISIVLTLIGVW